MKQRHKLKLKTTEDFETKEEHFLSSAKDMDLIEEKHQKIVDGACKLFFEKGYHKTTIREIATAANMSMGQLYHYISSKDDVLFLIYKHMQMTWWEHLVQSRTEEIKDPLLRFKRALYSTLDLMLKNKDLFLFIYTETKYLQKNHLYVVLEMDDKTVVGFWRRLLRDLSAEMEIDNDIDFLANIISYIMVFLPLRGWNLKDGQSKDHVNSIIKFILNGLGVTK